jgi:DnaD/phage-associated family protein
VQIISGTKEFNRLPPAAVAIGKFDGVHRGHRKLIGELLARKAQGLCAAILTFTPAPETFFGFGDGYSVTTQEEKRRIFSELGIDYLIEYCVSRGHGNFSYIEKVALNWHKEGISSVRDARLAVQNYHREYYDILKALGLDNHHPVEEEIRIMKQWLEKYNFPMSMIREACSRTIMGAGKPSLKYADGILSKWYRAGVRSFEDIERLDAEHARSGIAASQKKNARAPKPTAFNSFEQRKDDDNLDELLLKKTRALYGSMNKEE